MAGESSSKPKAIKDAGGSSSKPKATKDDAYAYLRAVKDAFPNDRDKYDDFISIMNNFKARRYIYIYMFFGKDMRICLVFLFSSIIFGV